MLYERSSVCYFWNKVSQLKVLVKKRNKQFSCRYANSWTNSVEPKGKCDTYSVLTLDEQDEKLDPLAKHIPADNDDGLGFRAPQHSSR